MTEIATPRLILRPWRTEDIGPWAALNADPEVMRHFPSTLTRPESEAMARRIRELMRQQGWGLWAVEVSGGAPFIGFVGLNRPTFTAPFTPCVEIGWRLARAHWGNGYATEAARAALQFGFQTLELAEIVAFTAVGNDRWGAVMERLGMSHDPSDDFEHPNIVGRLRRHVLYRARNPGLPAA